jgi:hypothetical protein
MANWWDKNLTDKQKFRLQEPKDPSLLDVVSTVPNPVGDVASGLLAAQDFSKGNYGTAALNALGLLPFVPSMGASIKNVGKSAKTEFELAHDLAQQRAALPVAEGGLGLPASNTAMDRAKAMGFDTNVYHGQSPKSQKTYYEGLGYVNEEPVLNELKKVIPNAGSTEGGALWTSPDIYLANKYATNNGAVYPLKIRSADLTESGFTKPFPTDVKLQPQWFKDVENFNRSLDRTKAKYFQDAATNNKAVAIRNIEDNPGDSMSPYVSDVIGINTAPTRSRFAAFDPFRRNESDILAGVAPLAAGSLLGLNTYNNMQDKPKKEKKKTK